MVSCRLVLSCECFYFSFVCLFVSLTFHGHLQIGSFMGGGFCCFFLFLFLFLSLSWSIIEWFFHGNASVPFGFFVNLPWSVADRLFHGSASGSFVLSFAHAFHGQLQIRSFMDCFWFPCFSCFVHFSSFPCVSQAFHGRLIADWLFNGGVSVSFFVLVP